MGRELPFFSGPVSLPERFSVSVQHTSLLLRCVSHLVLPFVGFLLRITCHSLSVGLAGTEPVIVQCAGTLGDRLVRPHSLTARTWRPGQGKTGFHSKVGWGCLLTYRPVCCRPGCAVCGQMDSQGPVTQATVTLIHQQPGTQGAPILEGWNPPGPSPGRGRGHLWPTGVRDTHKAVCRQASSQASRASRRWARQGGPFLRKGN